jgi:hypothetical protein
MRERSHWWLAAVVVFLGAVFPVAIFSLFGIEPDRGLVPLALCAALAAVAACAYWAWVMIRPHPRRGEDEERDRRAQERAAGTPAPAASSRRNS